MDFPKLHPQPAFPRTWCVWAYNSYVLCHFLLEVFNQNPSLLDLSQNAAPQQGRLSKPHLPLTVWKLEFAYWIWKNSSYLFSRRLSFVWGTVTQVLLHLTSIIVIWCSLNSTSNFKSTENSKLSFLAQLRMEPKTLTEQPTPPTPTPRDREHPDEKGCFS